MDVGIVCSYGVILDRRLQTYLGTLIRYVTTRQIHTLILSGGQTRTSIVKTEARVLYEALQPRLPYISCILEEHAITTFHNLRYSKAILEQRHIPVDTLYIFCDSARFFKVRCLARLLFAGTRVHVVKFPRKEPFLDLSLASSVHAAAMPGRTFPLSRESAFEKSPMVDALTQVIY